MNLRTSDALLRASIKLRKRAVELARACAEADCDVYDALVAGVSHYVTAKRAIAAGAGKRFQRAVNAYVRAARKRARR